MQPDSAQLVFVYKVMSADAWRQAVQSGTFPTAPEDARDGFVHLSDADQVEGVLLRYFAAVDDLVLVAFNADALGPNLRREPSANGELFPHLHGRLEMEAVVGVAPVAPPGGAGRRAPAGLLR